MTSTNNESELTDSPKLENLTEFLIAIGFNADDSVTLACLDKERNKPAKNHSTVPISLASVWADRWRSEGNCYFATAVMLKNNTQESNVARSIMVAADLDDKCFADGHSAPDLLALIDSHFTSVGMPVAIERTGNGDQAFWTLGNVDNAPAHVGVIRKNFIRAVNQIGLESGILVKALDQVGRDAHIMRLPTTLNHKDPKNIKDVFVKSIDASSQPVDVVRLWDETLTVLGIDGSDARKPLSKDVVSARSAWPVPDEPTGCTEASRMADYFEQNYREGKPDSRHEGLVQIVFRHLACERYGCCTAKEAEHSRQAINERFYSMFTKNDIRTPDEFEADDIWKWAEEKISRKTDEQYIHDDLRESHLKRHDEASGLVIPSVLNKNVLPYKGFYDKTPLLTRLYHFSLAREVNPDAVLASVLTYVSMAVPYYVQSYNRRRAASQTFNLFVLILGRAGDGKGLAMSLALDFLQREGKYFGPYAAPETKESVAAMYVDVIKPEPVTISSEQAKKSPVDKANEELKVAVQAFEDERKRLAEEAEAEKEAKAKKKIGAFAAILKHPADVAKESELASDLQFPCKQITDRYLFVTDEMTGINGFEQVAAEAKGLFQVLTQAYFAYQLGGTVKTKKLRLKLLKDTYRLSLLLGIQPEKCSKLKEYFGGGLPQRLFVANASTSGITKEIEEHDCEDPNEEYPGLDEPWSPPNFGERDAITGKIYLEVPPEITRIIKTRQKQVRADESEDAASWTHMETFMLRLAYLLEFLHGNTELSMEMWDLVDVHLRIHHKNNWDFIDRHIAWAHAKVNYNRGRANAEQKQAELTVLDKSSEKELTRVAQTIGRVIWRTDCNYHTGDYHTKTCINRGMAGRDKKHNKDNEALEEAIRIGYVKEISEGNYGKGDKKP